MGKRTDKDGKKGRRTLGSLKKRDKRGKTIPREKWETMAGTYWAVYSVNGKRLSKSLQTSSLSKAESKLQKLVAPYLKRNEAEKLRQVFHELRDAEADAEAEKPPAPRLLVAEAWTVFEANKERPQPSAVTLKDYRQRWKRFTDWWTAHHATERSYMEDVTSEDASAFGGHLEDDKLSSNRYNAVMNTASMVFKYTLPDSFNPFAKIRRKRLQTVNHRELTDDELYTVIDSAEGEFKSLFIIGVYTLFRLGDCATLQWSNITDDLSMISRKPRKTKSRSNKLVTVGVHPVLRAILEQIPPDQRKGDVLPAIAAEYRQDRTKTSRRIQKHFINCGIQMHPDNEEDETQTAHKTSVVGFHSLRHSGASIMSRRTGTGVNTLQHLLGHTSAALQSVYVHTTAEDTTKAVRMMPDVTKRSGKEAENASLSEAEKLAVIHARLLQEDGESDLVKELLALFEAQ